MLKNLRPEARRGSAQPVVTLHAEPLVSDRSLGLIYVAYGDKAKAYAKKSIQTARAAHPGVPVVVISDTQIPGASQTIVQPEADRGARKYKTGVYDLSPFDYTCYLDADTQIVGSLRGGFAALEAGWDIAAALDYRQTLGRIDHLPPEDLAFTLKTIGQAEFPHYNTGLLFFRKSPETEQLFHLWQEEWQVFKFRDQGAFLRAYYKSDAKLWTLSWNWNTHRQERATHVFHDHHAVDRQYGGTR